MTVLAHTTGRTPSRTRSWLFLGLHLSFLLKSCMCTCVAAVASGDVSTPATLAEQRIPTWGTGTTFQSNASQADSLAGPITSTAAGRTAGVISSGSGGGSGEAAEGGAGGSGSTTASERVQQAQSLLQSRSAAAVLRELKLGPVLGRGSYGRVHRARWKAATVAVKIIEHHEQGSAISSGGKRVNVGREAMLSTTISHPNVVSGGCV